MPDTPNLFHNSTTKTLTGDHIIEQYNEIAGHILSLEDFVLKKTWRIGSLHKVQLYLNTIQQIMLDIQNEKNFYQQHHHDSLVHDKAIYIIQGVCALNFSADDLHGFATSNKSMTAIIDKYDQHQHERLIKWMKQKFTYNQLESLSKDNLNKKFFTIKSRGESDDFYNTPTPSYIIQDAYDLLAYGQI